MDFPLEKVIKAGLCTGCGTCAGICPASAIRMMKNDLKGIYIPEFNNARCYGCQLCSKICPGQSVNIRELSLEFFGKVKADSLVGSVTNCYIGYATDNQIRYNSSSGGLLTALLIFALKQGVIDGALVTKMNGKRPLSASSFIAKTEAEIKAASKSKYCPVPANISLKDILREDGTFAIVGLPCHIHGTRKAQHSIKAIRRKINLCFGLACHHTPTFHATEYLLWKLGIDKSSVASIDYRGGGWPGYLVIQLRNNQKITIPYTSSCYWGHAFNSYFYSMRCSLCDDRVNELADITFMDAWLPELYQDSIGTSLVISRNQYSDELIKKAAHANQIKVKRISVEACIRSQALVYAKKQYAARYFIAKGLGRHVPYYDNMVLKPEFYNYRDAILHYIKTFFSNKPCVWRFI